MAQLRRSKLDGHYYILLGQSQGTRQINEGGISWLRKQDRRLPGLGEGVYLDPGDYRYLRHHGYLTILGKEYEKHEAIAFSSSTPDIEQYGPSLLLSLRSRGFEKTAAGTWRLLLKLDELDKNGQDALRNYRDAIAIGYQSTTSIQSMVNLRQVHIPTCWPEVCPKAGSYDIYWQNNEHKFFRLKEATPARGLRADWQGNLFRTLEHDQLADTWRRCRLDESLSLSACHELYWLARNEHKPEWPGQQHPYGDPVQGWQLWHLHAVVEDDASWEAIEQWLSWRCIKLVYPSWRLRLLNPLSSLVEERVICPPAEPILVQCNPPSSTSEQGQTRVCVSLTPIQNASLRQPAPDLETRSTPLRSHQVNYVRGQVLSPGQEYRLRVMGEANGQRISLRAASVTTRRPVWLRGLRCILTTPKKQFTFDAFSTEQQSSPHQLQVPDDVPPEELASLTWTSQPAGIPCSWRYEYLSPEGELCQKKEGPVPEKSVLTTLWQEFIWPVVAESPWVTLTLDAASFGTITMKLILKPEPPTSQEAEDGPLNVANQAWWTNSHIVASFFWLSRMAEGEAEQAQRAISPMLTQTLRQLCEPSMPAALQRVLISLATRRSLPAWIYHRVQAMLANLHVEDVSDNIIEKG